MCRVLERPRNAPTGVDPGVRGPASTAGGRAFLEATGPLPTGSSRPGNVLPGCDSRSPPSAHSSWDHAGV